MTDIVKRLRQNDGLWEAAADAADEIERLRAEVGRLKLELGNLASVDDIREVNRQAKNARNDALEEAARFCAEGNELAVGNYFAAGIRALKKD